MSISKIHSQLTSSVVLVQPLDFAYNEQTGLDNEFQSRPSRSELKNLSKVIFNEFDHTIEVLNSFGIETLVLAKQHTHKNLPDALFPNNWFSTNNQGELHIYPMKTQNRQDEVQISQLSNLLSSANYSVHQTFDLRQSILQGLILEGTGSLIFHHPSKMIFSAISERCQKQAVKAYASEFEYELNCFDTLSENNSPIYHSNVMMSCGEDFAVITQQVIKNNQQKQILNQLSNCCNDIIIINEKQMSQNFCGNILQLKDTKNQPVIAMSQSAYAGFKLEQKKMLEKHGSLAVCSIPTIEKIGGGSTRCMLAENFLEVK